MIEKSRNLQIQPYAGTDLGRPDIDMAVQASIGGFDWDQIILEPEERQVLEDFRAGANTARLGNKVAATESKKTLTRGQRIMGVGAATLIVAGGPTLDKLLHVVS